MVLGIFCSCYNTWNSQVGNTPFSNMMCLSNSLETTVQLFSRQNFIHTRVKCRKRSPETSLLPLEIDDVKQIDKRKDGEWHQQWR